MNSLRSTLAYFALVAFIATRAIMPAGFMPNAISSGALFTLCPADSGSARLLATMAGPDHAHHGAHHADHDHATHFADKECPFSGLGSVSATIISYKIAATAPLTTKLRWQRQHTVIASIHHRPAIRAPPLPRHLLSLT